MRLELLQRYKICQASAVVCFLIAVFALYRLTGAVLAHDGKTVVWFVVLVMMVLAGIGLQIAALYFRAASEQTDEQVHVAVETLAASQHTPKDPSDLL